MGHLKEIRVNHSAMFSSAVVLEPHFQHLDGDGVIYELVELLVTVEVPERVRSWHENMHLSANYIF